MAFSFAGLLLSGSLELWPCGIWDLKKKQGLQVIQVQLCFVVVTYFSVTVFCLCFEMNMIYTYEYKHIIDLFPKPLHLFISRIHENNTAMARCSEARVPIIFARCQGCGLNDSTKSTRKGYGFWRSWFVFFSGQFDGCEMYSDFVFVAGSCNPSLACPPILVDREGQLQFF